MTGTVYAARSMSAAHQGAAVAQRQPRCLPGPLQIPALSVPLLHRQRLTDLIDRAARHRAGTTRTG